MKSTSKKSTSFSRQRFLKLLVISLIAVALVLQIALDVVVWNRLVRSSDDTVITHLIALASEGTSKPAPVEAPTGNVYFPEARLVLPAPTNSIDQVLYSYRPAMDKSPDELQIVSRNALHSAQAKLYATQSHSIWSANDPSATFSQVPNLQACARGLHVFFTSDSSDNGYKLEFEKKLQDGRTVYAYTENNGYPCGFGFNSFVASLKQIDSY